MSLSTLDQTRENAWNFDNSYARLSSTLFERANPVPVKDPGLVIFNRELAEELGLDASALEAQAAIFTGNTIPSGAEPIAQAYAGHQFGHFTMLGDGRAILLGEHLTPNGTRFDVQLKGSGRTPFSRGGDGRAALGPMLREYIISEAMHGLGIPTTRSLAVASTGEIVMRESALPGAILTRVAASHIRVGTFQFVAGIGDAAALLELTDYTLYRHYPEAMESTNGALALLTKVIEKQAGLVAKWMLVGFVHGVMNTDNMALSGETIDYGPCAFMDAYDPDTVFSSIDRDGRYAYGNQARIAQWNLARLAEALLPLLDSDEKKAVEIAKTVLAGFAEKFQQNWLAGMRAKLGLFNEEPDDVPMIDDLLKLMKQTQADYTNTLRALAEAEFMPGMVEPGFQTWKDAWQSRLRRQTQQGSEVTALMLKTNPAIIPRNHRVEEALAAAGAGDLGVMHRLLAALREPYLTSPENADYCQPPKPGARIYQTFCGT